MDLDDFIAESLMQIAKGVHGARTNFSKEASQIAVINPKWGEQRDHSVYTSEVSFDIAISVTEQTERGGKVGLKVVALEIGGVKGSTFENSRINRISFKVPVYFAQTEIVDAAPRDVQPAISSNAE